MTDLRDPRALTPHPQNASIYGDDDVADLVESIRGEGVLQPLIVTADNVVLAGHRRRRAAIKLGVPLVPVLVHPGDDPLDHLAVLVGHNRHRQKTAVQVAREAQTLLEIEQQRAARRAKEGNRAGGVVSGVTRRGDVKSVENVPPTSDAGKARDKVGEALGVSGKTVEKMVAVVERIDELAAAGEADAAKELGEAMGKSVSKAYRQATGTPAATPPATAAANVSASAETDRDALAATAAKMREARALLRQVRALLAEVATSPGGEWLAKAFSLRGGAKAEIRPVRDLITTIYGAEPVAVGHCSDPQCAACAGRGWVNRSGFNDLARQTPDAAARLARLPAGGVDD